MAANRAAYRREWARRNPEKCRAASARYRELHPDKARECAVRTQKQRSLRHYGISLDDYNRMLAEQGGHCAVCGDPLETPCVDHCHSTGAVRGLLCRGCNGALGYLEKPDWLLNASAYLDKQKENEPSRNPGAPTAPGSVTPA